MGAEGWGGNSIENRDSEIFRDPDLLFSGRRWRIPVPPNTLSKYWSQRLNKHDIAKHKTDLEPIQMDILEDQMLSFSTFHLT